MTLSFSWPCSSPESSSSSCPWVSLALPGGRYVVLCSGDADGSPASDYCSNGFSTGLAGLMDFLSSKGVLWLIDVFIRLASNPRFDDSSFISNLNVNYIMNVVI